MPRKPLIYTHENPYHISARSNNKEWFYMPMSECWNIFIAGLNHIHFEYGFKTHLFVLMNNHYHLIGTCSENHNLGEVMAWLQKYVSRKINARTGRINHIFGGAYRASLIRHPAHYAAVYKYVARNPVKAGMCTRVESHFYSTIHVESTEKIAVIDAGEWAADVPQDFLLQMKWLNHADPVELDEIIRKSLRRPVFTPTSKMKRKSDLTPALIQK